MISTPKINQGTSSTLTECDQARPLGTHHEGGNTTTADARRLPPATIPVSAHPFKKLPEDLLRHILTFLPQKALLTSRRTTRQLYQQVSSTQSLILRKESREWYDIGENEIKALRDLLSSQFIKGLLADIAFLDWQYTWCNMKEKSINVHTLDCKYWFCTEDSDYSTIIRFFTKIKDIHTLKISGALPINVAEISPYFCGLIKCLIINGKDVKVRNFGSQVAAFTALESLILQNGASIDEEDLNLLRALPNLKNITKTP